MNPIMPEINILPAFKFLFDKSKNWRYRGCYGGRGKGATWQFVRALLIKSLESKKRILCCREIQKSIDKSTYTVLKDQILLLGLSKYFDIKQTKIECANGSEFLFEGLYRNVEKIKSIEGIDIADIEEAENITDESLDFLTPTVRKDNSEIWFRWNTGYADDPIYERFVSNCPDNAIVKKINYDQNPHFPQVLKTEMDQDRAHRPWVVANKWDGEPLGKGRKVWPDFNDQIHVKEFPWDIVKQKGNCFMSIDPAQHYYPACIWFAVLPKPTGDGFYKYIYNEWPQYDDLGDDFHKARTNVLYTGTILEMAKQFYLKDGTAEHGLKIEKRFIDTRFAKGSGSGSFFSGETTGIVNEFAKKENGGLIFDCPAEILIDAQRSVITADLQINTLAPLSSINEPRLFIAPWCKNLITSMKNHRLEMNSEQESSRYKDFSDCLRIGYAGLDGYVYANPKKQNIYEYQGSGQYAETYSGGCGSSWMGA